MGRVLATPSRQVNTAASPGRFDQANPPDTSLPEVSLPSLRSLGKIWMDREVARVQARLKYDNDVLVAAQQIYAAQVWMNTAQADATAARTAYYAVAAELKKQSRERKVSAAAAKTGSIR